MKIKLKMASTPLYSFLKGNGSSLYVFPSSAQKLSNIFQNNNYDAYFSQFALLNLPAQNLNPGPPNNKLPVYFDFLNTAGLGYGFQQSISATPPTSFGDQVIESLRNYVANMEETMMVSKLNTTEYYFDNSSIYTSAEKIFFKWAKQLNLIGFEPANNGDQYIGTLPEFQSNNLNDTSFFPKIEWSERNIVSYNIYDYYNNSGASFSNNLVLVFQGTTNFQIGDIVTIINETNINATTYNGNSAYVLDVYPPTGIYGQQIVLSLLGGLLPISSFGSGYLPTINAGNFTGNATLVYNKLIQYIGDINSINNVQQGNQSYTQIYAQVSSEVGSTPDILFTTTADTNYKPNLIFPILPSQYQPEIIGAEQITSPIVQFPANYPGSYYGQFDTADFTYNTSTGDTLRRSGKYFGLSGDINTPIVNSTNLDGITIDFNVSHYAKMNIYGRKITNFDQFNALALNNLPPSNFNFNAILWYYNYTDNNGNIAQDLYGISFLDNPLNNANPDLIGLQFPLYNKLVGTNTQDGTAYDFSINLNYNIIDQNAQDVYNVNAINDVFSMNLYNLAIDRMQSLNNSFSDIITENTLIKTSLSNLTQLIYTQTQYTTINNQIANLNKLLQLYSTIQMTSSNTIQVIQNLSGTIPLIQLNSIDPIYSQISSLLTSNMYNNSGVIPINITLPTNKSVLIIITNNDQTPQILPNNNKLSLVLNTDLNYLQNIDIIINGNNIATYNKQLTIYINYSVNGQLPVLTPLISNIQLPVYYNQNTHALNSAATWKKFNFEIDINNNPIRLNTGSILEIPLLANGNLVNNSINAGDTVMLNQFTIGTSSLIDFSGQYRISSVGITNSYIYLDISTNNNLVSYGASSSLPLIFNNNSNYLLGNFPYINLNQGIKYSITNVDPNGTFTLQNRYLISKFNI